MSSAGWADWQLDGYIARTFNMKSIAGSYLDPIADKVLVMSVYLTLGSLNLIPGPTARAGAAGAETRPAPFCNDEYERWHRCHPVTESSRPFARFYLA